VALAPSGEQFELVHGEQRACVVEVGGGIREYAVAARPVLDPYPLEAMCDGGHGTPLIPWPNRLADGRYSFDGADHQLSLSEPANRNAIHGLLRWRSWRAREHEPDRVTLATRINPMTGYPFALDVSIEYRLGEDGLTVLTTSLNIGDRACPYGAGQHPYLSPGDGTIDECTLELGARTRIVLDERQLPNGSEPLAGSELDFSTARRLGEQRIDCALTELERDGGGCALARLCAPDGSTVELWADRSYTVLQLFTGDTLSPARRRRGLAVEPMTCEPNAFRSGVGLVRLEPGESLSTRWGVRLV
jgi:aldose 1-epimerase